MNQILHSCLIVFLLGILVLWTGCKTAELEPVNLPGEWEVTFMEAGDVDYYGALVFSGDSHSGEVTLYLQNKDNNLNNQTYKGTYQVSSTQLTFNASSRLLGGLTYEFNGSIKESHQLTGVGKSTRPSVPLSEDQSFDWFAVRK